MTLIPAAEHCQHRTGPVARVDRRRLYVQCAEHRGRDTGARDAACAAEAGRVGVGDRGTHSEASADQNVVESPRADLAGVQMILVVMGVSGSGKTTIAKALAERLGWAFEEGDELHPASDITKMHSGHPLDDRDRWPWLEKVADWIDGWRQAGTVRRDHLLGAQAQLSRLPGPRATGGARRLFARRQRADRRAPRRAQRTLHAGKPPRQPVGNAGGARPRRGSDLRRT